MLINQPTVFVGLSGGVDSSVAALRLKKEGYQVVGVFIKVWQPDWLDCNWEQERLDAMRVAARLDIPFLTCDAEQSYKDGVADYFISEYKAGRTPNPDVMCNKYVKFGTFLNFALNHGADFVATGHYVQKITNKTGIEEMHRGLDENKDQSYFLWTLKKDQLKHILFPVGNTKKELIRKEAADAGLLTAEKPDSQGICFLGHIDIREFLSHYIELEDGDVLDMQGKVIGRHKGALLYTNGQRHGFTINNKDDHRQAHFVVNRDINNNTITVNNEAPIYKKSSIIKLRELNIINQLDPLLETIEIQTRYRQKPVKAKVIRIALEEIELELLDDIASVSSGQSCVLYIGSNCLGGGIIV